MKRVFSVIMVCLLCLSMFSVVAPRASAPAIETPLQVAEKAATWTISQAIYENGGYKWADYMQAPYYDASVQYGSAGYGTLYLELYQKTGNSMYLDYAKGAAQWIVSQAVPDSGGYKWPHHDDSIPSPGWWLSPAVSGIGEFLLQMYKTTGTTTYLDYASGAAQWLMAMAYWGEPGCFIPYNPPNPYGTQASHGIDPAREAYTVAFLLHMYEETGNSIYLKYVTGTAEWLISGPDKIVSPSGYEWRFNRPFYYDYPLDGEGRIALFFYEIYEALGNPTYLQYAQGTMNWLLSQAIVNGNTAKWYDPVIGCCRTLPFSGCGMGGVAGFWGVPEPNELLMSVYDTTKNPTYLDYAKKLANWMISPAIAVAEGGGYKFPDSEGGSIYSAYQNAKIYNFLSWLYSITGDTSYRDYADGALQWIVFNATEANGGYEWRTIPWFPYYATMFESGAAGIGYYLVSAHTARVPSLPLSLKASSGYSEIQLSWNPPSDLGGSSIQQYSVYRSTSSQNEVFLGSVDGNTLKFTDTSVSANYLYYYYVRAVNAAGESPPSDEVKNSVWTSIKGIETAFDLDSYTTELSLSFTIQQNFWIYGGQQSYWAQNLMIVYPLVQRMAGAFEIYNDTFPSKGQKVVGWLTTYHSGSAKSHVTLRSTIEGNSLEMANDFSTLSWQIPEGARQYVHIDSFENPAYGSSEIAVVGPLSLPGLASSVNFLSPTAGKVDTYVRIGAQPGIWLYGTNKIIRSPDHASTAETSKHLEWNTLGDFQYSSQAADQGMWFGPAYTQPTVTPPTVPPPQGSQLSSTALTVHLECPANLSLFDSSGHHVGYNTTSEQVDQQIPDTLFVPSDDSQAIFVINPSGDYQIEVIGTGIGNYRLTIEYANDTQVVTKTYSGTIFPEETEYYSAVISSTGQITPISWDYVFKDAKRGTMLKISKDNKYFQFTAPGKDFGIKQDPKMIVLKNTIGICYNDGTMRLIAAAIFGRIDFCSAVALDKQTNKVYLLIDIRPFPIRCRDIEQLK